MNYLICSKSLVGFLSAVYDSYYENKTAEAISSDINSCNLTDLYVEIFDDIEKAKKVRGGIIKNGGHKLYDAVCDAYRSCNPNKEKIIFEYLRLFFSKGKATLEMLSDDRVIKFNDLINKVFHEVHRVSAFVRLQEMSNGIYYGYYSSDNDILERVASSLRPQFNSMQFIIHDYKRRKMAFYDLKTIHYFLSPEKIDIELSETELFFQNIWKNYHENVTIKERKNERQQNHFLPKKYRHFMNEF